MVINDALKQAVLCHQTGQLQEAEGLYRSILKSQPHQPDANHNLGLLAMQVGQPASGLPFLQSAWKLNPSREKFSLTLTECLLKLDRPNEALQIIKNAPMQMGVRTPRSGWLLQLATSIAEGVRPPLSVDQETATLFNAGHHAELEARLTFLLNQYPNWGEGWSALCTAQQVQGKDGEDALQRALQIMPTDASPRSQRKIFCIGANKTGTTSIYEVFRSLGLIIGNQGHAESLIHDWAKQDYRRLIRYCQSAEAFQDVPFSLDNTFQAMDEAFPGSKFILTVRNNADEWHGSVVRYLSKTVGKGRIPTAADLRKHDYRYPGYISYVLRVGIHGDESKPLDRDLYTQWYEEHNNKIEMYFKDRPEDLLVLNVGDPDAMERLLIFLGYPYLGQKMPHLNSSKDQVS